MDSGLLVGTCSEELGGEDGAHARVGGRVRGEVSNGSSSTWGKEGRASEEARRQGGFPWYEQHRTTFALEGVRGSFYKPAILWTAGFWSILLRKYSGGRTRPLRAEAAGSGLKGVTAVVVRWGRSGRRLSLRGSKTAGGLSLVRSIAVYGPATPRDILSFERCA